MPDAMATAILWTCWTVALAVVVVVGLVVVPAVVVWCLLFDSE